MCIINAELQIKGVYDDNSGIDFITKVYKPDTSPCLNAMFSKGNNF